MKCLQKLTSNPDLEPYIKEYTDPASDEEAIGGTFEKCLIRLYGEETDCNH